MISPILLLCLQDLNNSNLNPGEVSGGGYGAPGGPVSSVPSVPFYRVHGADWSPRSSTPSSPTLHRAQLCASPSSGFSSPSSFADRSVSPPAGGFVDPELLLNKSASELPQGVDPSQREVGAGSRTPGANGTKALKSLCARC